MLLLSLLGVSEFRSLEGWKREGFKNLLSFLQDSQRNHRLSVARNYSAPTRSVGEGERKQQQSGKGLPKNGGFSSRRPKPLGLAAQSCRAVL